MNMGYHTIQLDEAVKLDAGTRFAIISNMLEYYETWDESEFPDAYRGGASLIRRPVRETADPAYVHKSDTVNSSIPKTKGASDGGQKTFLHIY